MVAVPGFLRTMDFGVHYDWTSRQRSDRQVIGTAKAVDYLRTFRHIDNHLNYREDDPATEFVPDKFPAFSYDNETVYEDNLFLGELIRERLELVEASLPLRIMRQVFLPYADVSERMTNTAGVSNLLPKIIRVTPRYIPSHHDIELTIEGKNFDTGRIEVIVGGRSATDVRVLNEGVIVATLAAREFISDLTIQARKDPAFVEAIKAESGKNLLHDIEGLVDVMVITPTGVDRDIALIRLTSPKGVAPPAMTGKLPTNASICNSPIFNEKSLVITLQKPLKATGGTLVLKHSRKTTTSGKTTTVEYEVRVDVVINKDKVTIRHPLDKNSPPGLGALVGAEVSDIRLFPLGSRSSVIKISGKLKVEKLTAKVDPPDVTFKVDGKGSLDKDSFKIKFSHPVIFAKGAVAHLESAKDKDKKHDVKDLPGLKGDVLTVKFSPDDKNRVVKLLSANKPEVKVKLKDLERGSRTADEIDCGTFKLTKTE